MLVFNIKFFIANTEKLFFFQVTVICLDPPRHVLRAQNYREHRSRRLEQALVNIRGDLNFTKMATDVEEQRDEALDLTYVGEFLRSTKSFVECLQFFVQIRLICIQSLSP